MGFVLVLACMFFLATMAFMAFIAFGTFIAGAMMLERSPKRRDK